MILLVAGLLGADPLTVSLDQLRTEPDRYAGQIVRVSGQMNECWGWTCRLCPEEASSARPMVDRCLAIEFAGSWPAEPV